MPATVVQARVVQAQPLVQPLGFILGQVQPLPVSVPVQGTPVGGQPMYAQQGGMPMSVFYDDQQTSTLLWMGYGIGWVVCCCCFGSGICVWPVLAFIYYCKPPEARRHMPRSAIAAHVNMATCLACGCCGVIALIIAASTGGSKGVDKCKIEDKNNETTTRNCFSEHCEYYMQTQEDSCSCECYNEEYTGRRRQKYSASSSSSGNGGRRLQKQSRWVSMNAYSVQKIIDGIWR